MKGISETVGMLIILIVLIGILVPLVTVLLSNPTHQEQQLEGNMPYFKMADLQYSDFKPVGNFLEPEVSFVYNVNNNSVEFIVNKVTPLIPLEIEYLQIFNGTEWVKLGITSKGGTWYALPNSSYNSVTITINKNTTIYLPKYIKPYKEQSSYVAAITQYGNIIYAVQESLWSKYIYEAFSATSSCSLANAFPEYVTYYSNTTVTKYWNLGLPVLQLANKLPNGTATEGVVFWEQKYVSNKSISIVIIGTYSQSWLFCGHGFDFYLFLNPDQYQWSISPIYNSSNKFLGFEKGYETQPGGSGGTMGFPASAGDYFVVSWDPGWATYELDIGGIKSEHGNGMWDLFTVDNINGVYPQINIIDLGNGTGLWLPQPDDFIIINVTYNPVTNILHAYAYDYNTSEISTFSANLSGIFTPPKSGNYVFGVGSGNAWLQANWGIIYINVPFLQPLFSQKISYLV